MAKRQIRADMGASEAEDTATTAQDAPPHTMRGTDTGSADDTIRLGQSQMDMVLQRATRAIEDRINRLQVPREAMAIGENVVGALLGAQDPLRRSFKKEPVLTGLGVASLAAGGLLLGIAIAKSMGNGAHRVAKAN